MNLSKYVPKKTFLKSGWGWIGKAKSRQYVTVLDPDHTPVKICSSVAQARAYIRANKDNEK